MSNLFLFKHQPNRKRILLNTILNVQYCYYRVPRLLVALFLMILNIVVGRRDRTTYARVSYDFLTIINRPTAKC